MTSATVERMPPEELFGAPLKVLPESGIKLFKSVGCKIAEDVAKKHGLNDFRVFLAVTFDNCSTELFVMKGPIPIYSNPSANKVVAFIELYALGETLP